VTEFIIAALAIWRVSRIVAAEDGPFDLLAKARARLRVNEQATWWQRGATCIACTSFWLGLGFAFSMMGFTFGALVYGLALSAAATVLMRKVG
jgi:hypothetical protein